MMEIAASYDEGVNEDSRGLTSMLLREEEWMEVGKVTTKLLQSTLKIALNKVSSQDFNLKLGLTDYNKEFIGKFRNQCKNVKLRHTYFRLIHKDFFTMEKMLKYKMVNDNRCKRCGEVETYRHLLWECREAGRIWRVYSEYMVGSAQTINEVLCYEDVFKIGDLGNVSKVKMKIIQEMIQVECPVNWTIENVKKVVNEIKNIELYNAAILGKLEIVKIRWGMLSG